MHGPQYLVVLVILCAVIFCAGCTQNSGTQSPVVPAVAPATSADPAALVLAPSEVPDGFSLVESRQKNITDVGKIAKDLGYQNGYEVRYVTSLTDPRGQTEILHAIAIYPEQNLRDIVALADRQDRSNPDFTYRDISLTGLGDNSRGFFGNASAQVLIKPVETNPLYSGFGNKEGYAVFTRDTAEIIFSKGNTFEILRMTGPGADVQTLISLAQKAYNKIP